MKKKSLRIKGIVIQRIHSIVKTSFGFLLFKNGNTVYLISQRKDLKIFKLINTKHKPSFVNLINKSNVTFKLGLYYYYFQGIMVNKHKLIDLVLTKKSKKKFT